MVNFHFTFFLLSVNISINCYRFKKNTIQLITRTIILSFHVPENSAIPFLSMATSRKPTQCLLSFRLIKPEVSQLVTARVSHKMLILDFLVYSKENWYAEFVSKISVTKKVSNTQCITLLVTAVLKCFFLIIKQSFCPWSSLQVTTTTTSLVLEFVYRG